MSEGSTGTKRRVNDAIRVMRDFRDDEPIPSFCECEDERCCQAVWLTRPNTTRPEPRRSGWRSSPVTARPRTAPRSSLPRPAWRPPATREYPDGRYDD
jgi:hypothetical protein